MNENYLLYNEMAKKLYFEYAKELPIITLCSQNKSNDFIYNNASEAFLLNDIYKLNAMRDCEIDEKYITGDASDYEKFKAFCSVLPKFAGHPLYIISHIELEKYFDCQIEINESNAEIIWNHVNNKINSDTLTETKLLEKTNVHLHKLFEYFYPVELEKNYISDLASLETDIITKIRNANEVGCKVANSDVIHDFIKPNPYSANEAIKKIKNNIKLTSDESTLLEMQIARTFFKEIKTNNWTLLIPAYAKMNSDAIRYLKDNDLMPNTVVNFVFEANDSISDIESALRTYCRNYPLGRSALTLYSNNQKLSYAQHEHFRRAFCTVLGKWIENGEYTSDETILKKLIEDTLYNNLKEAIG